MNDLFIFFELRIKWEVYLGQMLQAYDWPLGQKDVKVQESSIHDTSYDQSQIIFQDNKVVLNISKICVFLKDFYHQLLRTFQIFENDF